MTKYKGYANGKVFVDNPSYFGPLDPRLDLRNHSPTGFGWGYGGSGAAQLALAILVHHLGQKTDAELRQLAALAEMTLTEAKPHEALALMHYQKFKFAVLGNLPQGDNFELTSSQVATALDAILRGIAMTDSPWLKAKDLNTFDDKLTVAIEALKQIANFGHAPGCNSNAPVYECCCFDKEPKEIAKEALDKLGETMG